MPVLHMQLGAQEQTPNGKIVQLPPFVALQQRGPILQASVGIEQNAAKALASQGKSAPTPATGLALIDTGAACTCIDDSAAQRIGLPVIDVAIMASASHAGQRCNVYPVQIVIQPTRLTFNVQRAVGATLQPHGLLVLVGRDILSVCTMFYNGPAGTLTLAL